MPITTYSFRAECPDDVEKFHQQCLNSGLITAMRSTSNTDGLRDVEVEMETEASLETIRGLMRKVIDGHVMLQTLKDCPLADNMLERDYDLH